MTKIALPALVIVCLLSPGLCLAEAAVYHHVHLRASDTPAAAQWYARHFGGTVGKVATFDSATIDHTLFIFFAARGEYEGSAGSVVDHIGFSFPDLDAKMEEFREEGVKILQEPRQLGDFKFGFIEAPWGTKIEVMQDPETLGFHHIHVMSKDPEAALKWYRDAFGGEAKRFKGLLPANRYGDLWLIVQKTQAELAPTKDRALDHLSWGFADLDAQAVRLKELGVKFTLEPTPFGDLKIAFVESPEGVRIELVEVPATQ